MGPNSVSSQGNSLSHLVLSKNQLSEIPSEAIKPLKNLDHLNLNDNELVALRAHAFAGLSKVGRSTTCHRMLTTYIQLVLLENECWCWYNSIWATLALWTTTTCQQWPLIWVLEGGRCTLNWLNLCLPSSYWSELTDGNILPLSKLYWTSNFSKTSIPRQQKQQF